MGATSNPPQPSWRKETHSVRAKLEYVLTHENCHQDVIFIVGTKKEKIPAHQFILTLGSPVFEEHFRQIDFDFEDEIVVPDVEPTAFKYLLQFIYTDKFPVKPEEALSVLHAAKKYVVPELVDRCVTLLRSNISYNNVISIFHGAEALGEKELHDSAFDFILQNAERIMLTPDFLKMSHANLCTFLGSDELCIDELSLFRAALRWAEEQCHRLDLDDTPTNKRHVLNRAIALIRYPLLTMEEFTMHVVSTDVLSSTETIELFKYFSVSGQHRNQMSSHTFSSKRRATNRALFR